MRKGINKTGKTTVLRHALQFWISPTANSDYSRSYSTTNFYNVQHATFNYSTQAGS